MNILDKSDAIALNTTQAMAALNIGKTTLFKMIERGDIATIRMGRKLLIHKDEIARIIAASTSRKVA
ncbi:MAG: helix-turn-helix domain-containing protein [Hyphomicrobiales bacterium]|nr:helix-turn-helix domain-containing protein [Hyphomicrobiales bacterium]MDE2116053.1 helix-turn-helix domain-containing protein [Hyphomicrobiales bacterium]